MNASPLSDCCFYPFVGSWYEDGTDHTSDIKSLQQYAVLDQSQPRYRTSEPNESI